MPRTATAVSRTHRAERTRRPLAAEIRRRMEEKPRFGPRAFFPGKEARPNSVSLTSEAREVMEAGQRRTGTSRADFVEACIRKAGPSITRAEIESLAGQ